MDGTVFPSHGLRVLSSVVHILGVSVCVFCLARRTAGEDFCSVRGLQHISGAKWCVLLVFLDSWFFVALSGLLIEGVGLSVNHASCELGIVACIAFYAASKLLIYIFLIEKVYIVWNAGSLRPRAQCPVYLLCMLILAAYAAVVVLMVLFRLAQLDGATCVIGLRPAASIALLSYDLFVNVWLTGLFLWPLARTTLTNVRLRRVALRTLAAAGAALTTSTLNIVVLAILHGKELGWICLGSCGADVTLNAVVLYWVTAPAAADALVPPPDLPKQVVGAIAGHVGSYTDSGDVLGSDWDLDSPQGSGSGGGGSGQTHSSLSIRFALPATYRPFAEQPENVKEVTLQLPASASASVTQRQPRSRWELASSSVPPGHSRSTVSWTFARALRRPTSPSSASAASLPPSTSASAPPSHTATKPCLARPSDDSLTPAPPRPSRAYKATRVLGGGDEESARYWPSRSPSPSRPPPPPPTTMRRVRDPTSHSPTRTDSDSPPPPRSRSPLLSLHPHAPSLSSHSHAPSLSLHSRSPSLSLHSHAPSLSSHSHAPSLSSHSHTPSLSSPPLRSPPLNSPSVETVVQHLDAPPSSPSHPHSPTDSHSHHWQFAYP